MLHQMYSQRKYVFIYNGEVLDGQKSLSSFGIKNEDTIIAIPEPGAHGVLPSRADHWLNVTRTSDSFGEFVQPLMTPATRGESLRMRDTRMMRLEANPGKYRRLRNRYDMNPDRDVIPIAEKLAMPPITLEPSVDPLPILW
jgi:hypothetical protein